LEQIEQMPARELVPLVARLQAAVYGDEEA
jgi:hypothetical protein